MGFQLDAIIKEELVGSRDELSISFETINFTGSSRSGDISGSEQGFLLLAVYTNGVAANITFRVEGSSDNENFAPIPGLEKVVTDSFGSITFDGTNINANYVRLAWEVAAGSVDIYGHLSAKSRH